MQEIKRGQIEHKGSKEHFKHFFKNKICSKYSFYYCDKSNLIFTVCHNSQRERGGNAKKLSVSSSSSLHVSNTKRTFSYNRVSYFSSFTLALRIFYWVTLFASPEHIDPNINIPKWSHQNINPWPFLWLDHAGDVDQTSNQSGISLTHSHVS